MEPHAQGHCQKGGRCDSQEEDATSWPLVDHEPPRSGGSEVEWLSDMMVNRGKTPCSNGMTVRRLPHPLLILKSAIVGNIHPKAGSNIRHGRISLDITLCQHLSAKGR